VQSSGWTPDTAVLHPWPILARARTWHGSPLEQSDCSQSSADLAPDAEQVKCEGVRSAGCGAQLVLPVHKAGGGGITKHKLLVATRVNLQTNQRPYVVGRG
jgi:hypothetical protein